MTARNGSTSTRLALVIATASSASACRGRPSAAPARLDATARVAVAVDAAAGPATALPVAPPSIAQPTAPTRPSYACTIRTPAHDVGHHANITSLTLQRHADVDGSPLITLAWTVPPLFAHGGDDLAAITLDFDGDLVATLDPEEQSNARGLVRSPANIARVFAVPRDHATTLATDQLSRDDDDNDLLEAGDLSVQIATVDPGTDDAPARHVVPDAPFYLRTAYDASPSFVLGMRAAAGADVVSDTVRFFIARGTVPASREHDFWPLPVANAAAIRRAPNPAAALREIAPEGLEVVTLPGVGYVVVFQYQHRDYLGWLDRSLHPVGEPSLLPASGPSLGLPHVAVGGGNALVVYADRAARVADAAAPRYRLQATLAAFGHAPGAAVALATGVEGDFDVFAPTPAAQADGSWWLGFTVGDVEPSPNRPPQHVYVRAFDAHLAPLGDALQVSNDDSMSDQRVLATPEGLLVAMTRGRDSPRAVSVAAVRCARPATGDAGP